MDIQSSELNQLFTLYPVIIPGWVTPVQPDGIADGGIPKALYDYQTQGLEILVDPPTEMLLRSWTMAADDRVDLYVNDDPTPATGKTVAAGEEHLRIRLYLPHGRLDQGKNRLYYKVTRPSGNVEPSRDLFVLYYLRIAEGLDLVIPPDVLTNGVDAARAAQGVEFGFTFSNRRDYSRIEFLLGDTTIRFNAADLPTPIVQKLFTDAFQKAGDNPSAVAEFYVIDQLGNRSKSPEKRLGIHLSQLTLLPPTVRGQSGNNFSPTQPEIRVLVPQGPLLPPDKLSVTWAGAIAVPAASYTSPQRLVSAGLEIAVPRSVLAYSLGKTVTVTYVIERDGVPTTSPPLTLNILPLPATALNPPKIIEADASNVLDIIALGTKNATIHALLHTLMEAGQHCWLSLLGKKADGTAHNLTLWSGYPAKVNDTWVSQGFWPAALANNYLKQLGHGTTLTIKYKVALDKSNLEANAVVFPDRVYTIKAVELVAPTLTSVKGSPSGTEIPQNGTTVETAVTLSGVAAKGQEVEIFDGATSKGRAPANATTGVWTLPVSDLTVAAHSFKAKALYGTGAESAVRTLTVTAATAPTLTSVKGSPSGTEIPQNGTTIETAVTLSGAAAKGQEVEIFDGATSKGRAPVNATTGVWTLLVSGLTVAAHSFKARALYGTGAESAVRTLTVTAATAPTLTSVKGSPSGTEIPQNGTTIETAVTLSGIAANGQEVEIFDGATSKGRAPAHATTGVWTLSVSGLTVAAHNFKARALYGTGAESAVRTLTVTAAVAPTITTVKGSPSGANIPPGGTTRDTTVILTGTAAKGQKVDVLDGTTSKGQPFADAATGIWSQTVPNLRVGNHSFTVKALYGSGAASQVWTVIVPIAPRITSVFNANTGLPIPSGTTVYAGGGDYIFNIIGWAGPAGTVILNRLPQEGGTGITIAANSTNWIVKSSFYNLKGRANFVLTDNRTRLSSDAWIINFVW